MLLGLAVTAHAATTITEQNLAYYWNFNDNTSAATLTGVVSNTSNGASISAGSLPKTWSADGSKADDGYITTGTSSGNQNALKMSSMTGSSISLQNFSISLDIKDYAGGAVLFNINNRQTLNTSLGIWGGGGTASGAGAIESSSEWATYVFSFSGNTMTVYRNGVQVHTLTGETLSGSLTSLTLGNDSSNEGNAAIKASLDNLAIWNKAMNADDAMLLYQSDTPNQLVPEAATASLGLLGVAMLLGLRRRAA